MSVNMKDLGFEESQPGHVLEMDPKGVSNWQAQYYTAVKCTCGMNFHARKNANGKADNRSVRVWKNHLANVQADSSEIYHIGRMKRKSGWMDVYVFPIQYDDIATWAKPGSRYGRWIDLDKPTATVWYSWIVGTKIGNRHTIKSTAQSKDDAFISARNLLLKENDKGFEIEFSDKGIPATVEAPALKAKASMLTILTRIDEAVAGKDVKKIEEIEEEVREAIGLLPILVARQTELSERRYELLTRKFSI